MSLLHEIQSAAVDGTADLETLLRKCRVLAARLKHEDFKNWIQNELDGYNFGTDVPDYRRFHIQCFGHFSGPFQSGLKNAPIPESCIPKELRKRLTQVEMRGGIGALKDLIDSCKGGTITYGWPADVNALFGHQIYERMVLMQGWGNLSKSVVVGILSTVRNRILSFALEIESSNPDAGEARPDTIPVPKETVSQIFNNYIYGNVGNVAGGHGIHQSAVVTVKQGSFESLEEYLRGQGVDEEDVHSLEQAVNSDPPPTPDRPFGKKVSAWMGKMIQKSAEGSWKVATGVASNLLSGAIKSYYGLHN